MEWDAMHSSCPFTSPSSTSTMPARDTVSPRSLPGAPGCPALTTLFCNQGLNQSERHGHRGNNCPVTCDDPPQVSRGKRHNSCSQGR